TRCVHVGAGWVAVSGRAGGGPAAAGGCGRMPLAELTAPAARLARAGVRLNAMQAYVFELLHGVVGATPEAAARYTLDGRPPREGELPRDPELADALDPPGAEGSAPCHSGR